MRAFISYSLNDAEQFVLTILSGYLKEQGFIVSANYDLFSNNIPTQLNKSNLFIGLITYNGNENDRVFNEWEQAISQKIPSLLLIESNVKIDSSILQHPNVIIFDKYNPAPSIELVKNKINSAKQNIQPKNNNAFAWILGGLAAIVLIGLLSKDKK